MAGKLVWNKDLETGHSRIDQQHKALVESLDQLQVAVERGNDKDEVGRILVFLRDYTLSHFAMEEALMTGTGYPDAHSHQKIHQDLIATVSDLVDRFDNGATGLSQPVLQFLQDWLTNHILGEDFRLAAYLRSRPLP